MLNKWWDGNKFENFVLISDIEPDRGKWLGYYLKIWGDRYGFNAEIIGGTRKILHEKIFITSNFKIEEVFTGEVLSAICALCNIYYYTGCDVVISKRMEPQPTDFFIRLLEENEDGLSFQASQSAEKRPRSPSPS
ncbi:hypothetical protein AVEN_18281-1 [Araneus ventricosus]|uniref:Uncharacterized protein n=1 Tax=Araneus ventricosus TaxID=182803 RepID=A0A4Y2AKN2_ARAVE|nr:hypothetical protein AVEN_18281-1 [Araneus ventricosus]